MLLAKAMGNDQRKSESKKAWKERERQELVSSIPISHQDLRDLFNHLDRGGIQCDHTLRETTAFLKGRGLDVEEVVAWLHDNGGFCDCEVIFNVDEKFGELVGR